MHYNNNERYVRISFLISLVDILESNSVRQINRIYHRSLVQTEKSQPEGKLIMPETRFTEFPALSFDPMVGISRSTSETDVCLFFLPIPLKSIIYHLSFLLFLTVYFTYDLPRTSFGVFIGAA